MTRDLPMLSRRAALLGLAATAGAATLGWSGLSLARGPTDKRFVLVILRGGLDGLAALPPHGDPAYASTRRGLALAGPGEADGVIDLDGTFGLHPSLEPLHALYTAGHLAPIHAAALPYRARSHFDAQDQLENGTDSPSGARDGWLNRALVALGTPPKALALGSQVPLVLRGAYEVASLDPSRDLEPEDDLLGTLRSLYADDPLLRDALERGVETREMASNAMDAEASGRGGRRGQRLQATVEAAATLLTAEDGPRIAVLEAGGWDTHANQGSGQGVLANRLAGLADGIVQLKDALGPAWGSTAVLVVTEFGRTVKPNGTRGTDHGTAGAAFLAGGAVRGGRVVADWPGLGASSLYEGRDLKATTDLRAVFKGVLQDHLGVPGLDAVFPGSSKVAPLGGLVT